jgi:hypothetical protein
MDKYFYINKFQPIVKPNLERLENSTLINLAIHQHRILLNNLIITNDNINTIKKVEMLIQIDNIFFTIYHFLMLNIEDENRVSEFLLNEDFVKDFLYNMNEFELMRIQN